MKYIVIVFILIFIPFLLFGNSYTKEDINKIEDKIDKEIGLSKVELMKYILYLQDELIKSKKESKGLIGIVIKEKEEKIKLLEDKIVILKREKALIKEMINNKNIVIMEKEAELRRYKREVDNLDNNSFFSYNSPFNLILGVSGGYDFLLSHPIIFLSIKPTFKITDCFFIGIDLNFGYNFDKFNLYAGVSFQWILF